VRESESMNFRHIFRMLGNIFLIEALFLIPPAILSIYDREPHVLWPILFTMGLLVSVFLATKFFLSPRDRAFYAREGFLLVALSWILVSAFGALPFALSGAIPNYLDAFFESVSGFTTTGATIVTDISTLSRALLFWRSFTHWMGGMGILVFLLALLRSAKGSGDSLFVLRAESPGPAVEKIVPKTREHAAILYTIYIGMTTLCLILLLLGGLPVFDSFCIALGTAGTGGCGILPDSVASYSPYIKLVITIFMALFGINFNLYFLLLAKRVKNFLRDEELRIYLCIMAFSILIVTLNIMSLFDNFGAALSESAFTVSSMMTTTGFSSANYNAWPQLSRSILLILMMIGGSAGSTSGGLKIARLVLLAKTSYRGLYKLLHPRSVMLVKINKRAVGENVLQGISVYTTAYFGILVLSFLLLSIDNFSLETNLSAILACLNNVGTGLGAVAPGGSYAGFSLFSKLLLTFDMLLGRLEIFPLLLLFHRRSWNRAA